MKIMSIVAVLLALAAGNASAYSHSFANKSKFPVRFWVNYYACSNDTWATVKPGQTITWRSGLCCIKNTNVSANAEPNKSVTTGSGVTIDKPGKDVGQAVTAVVIAPFSFIEASMCYNTNWAVTSEMNPRLIKL